MAYLTHDQAADLLLEEYRIDLEIEPGYPELASRNFDTLGPFPGAPTDPEQTTQYPRDGETTPDWVLLWVAIEAARLQLHDSPPVTSESAGSSSKTYSAPKPARLERLQMALIAGRLANNGIRL